LINWLEQMIDAQRSVDLGLRIAGWLRNEIAEKLRQRLPAAEEGAVDWLDFALARWP